MGTSYGAFLAWILIWETLADETMVWFPIVKLQTIREKGRRRWTGSLNVGSTLVEWNATHVWGSSLQWLSVDWNTFFDQARQFVAICEQKMSMLRMKYQSLKGYIECEPLEICCYVFFTVGDWTMQGQLCDDGVWVKWSYLQQCGYDTRLLPILRAPFLVRYTNHRRKLSHAWRQYLVSLTERDPFPPLGTMQIQTENQESVNVTIHWYVNTNSTVSPRLCLGLGGRLLCDGARLATQSQDWVQSVYGTWSVNQTALQMIQYVVYTPRWSGVFCRGYQGPLYNGSATVGLVNDHHDERKNGNAAIMVLGQTQMWLVTLGLCGTVIGALV